MENLDYLEWRLIKNPVSGVKDTVIGKRKLGQFVVEEAMLIDNPLYLNSISGGVAVIDEAQNDG